jgi:tRNA dimethylallyltransferase
MLSERKSDIGTNKSYNLIVILGATASGKTRLAARLARELGSEIISADSRQVYRGMDIGTGKDLSEFNVDGVDIRFHLIDIADPLMEFSVFSYQKLFFESFTEISSRGIVPIMVGGTGLYIDSIIKNYEMIEVPENNELRKELQDIEDSVLVERLNGLNLRLHNKTDLTERSRIIRAIEIAEFSKKHGEDCRMEHPLIVPLIVGVFREREELRRRITKRLEERLNTGMIDEITKLNQAGIDWDKLDFFGLEYRYVGRYLRGLLTYREMFDQLNTKIHQFAKRQATWFRRMEKQGIKINWISGDDYTSLQNIIRDSMV